MNEKSDPIYIGNTIQQHTDGKAMGEFVNMLGDTFYKIKNYDGMTPFFISIVSSSNHWLFISSTGGLSAGRVSAEQALFPYYTDDKITENNDIFAPIGPDISSSCFRAEPLYGTIWHRPHLR